MVGAGISCDPPSSLGSARDVMKALVQYGCAKDAVDEILQYPGLRYEYLVQEFRDTYDSELKFMEYYAFIAANPVARHGPLIKAVIGLFGELSS